MYNVNFKNSGHYPSSALTDMWEFKDGKIIANDNGLFSEKVFGSEEEWRALALDVRGSFPISARWARLSKIVLPNPVTIVNEDKLAIYLGMSKEDVISVIDGKKQVVKEQRDSAFSPLTILTYSECLTEPKPVFVGSGDAVRLLIESVNFEDLKSGNEMQRRLYYDMLENGESAKDWVVDEIPVLPPEFRPFYERNGRFYSHLMNEAYKKIIIRSNRIRRIEELDAPKLILINESRLLQQAVNELIGGFGCETNPERCGFWFREAEKNDRFIGLVNMAIKAKKENVDDGVCKMLALSALICDV